MIDKIKKCIIAGYDSDIITREELDNMWNYITNLQEENERLKQPQVFIDTEDMEERYGRELYEDYLKEQIEEYQKALDETMSEKIDLQEENQRLLKNLDFMIDKNDEKQKVIDEANEYIEEHTDKLKIIRVPKIDFDYNKVLEILKRSKYE